MRRKKEGISKSRIVVTTSTFSQYDTSPMDMLLGKGLDVLLNPLGRKLSEAEVLGILQEERPIGMIAGTEPLTPLVLSHAGSYLKVISRAGTGWDNIDHEMAQKKGIGVFRTPDAVTDAVAELTVGLILNLLRRVGQCDRELKVGLWEKRMGSLLNEKRVGVIGCGRIGRRVGELLEAFGVRITINDVCQVDTPPTWTRLGLEGLLKEADVVTLHIAPEKGGGVLLDEHRIGCMKKGSWLINTSRGGLVDEQALYLALKSGRLRGAALDVFAQEPYEGPLRDLDNVILTPHIGSYAREARVLMEQQAASNLLSGLGMT